MAKYQCPHCAARSVVYWGTVGNQVSMYFCWACSKFLTKQEVGIEDNKQTRAS